MKKICLFSVCLFWAIGILLANQVEIDHYKKQASSQSGEDKVNTLNKLSVLLLADQQIMEAITFANDAFDLARQINFPIGQAEALNNQGLILQSKYDYTNAMQRFVASLKISNQADDQKGIATATNNIGKIYYLEENVTMALDKLKMALEIRKKINDQNGLAKTHKNLADVYLFKKLYGKAKEHYRSAMNIRVELGDYIGAAGIASFLGNIISDLGDYDGALVYYNMSLDLNSSIENLPNIAADLNNIAETHMAQKQWEEALEMNTSAYNIRKKEKDQLALAETYKNFAVIYVGMDKESKAHEYLNQTNNILKDLGAEPGKQDIYKEVAETYVKLKDYPMAYRSHVAYANSRDEIFSEEKSRALLELTTKYESEFEAEKQKQRITSLEQEQAYAAKINSFLYALIGLGSILIVVLFTSYKRKQKHNKLLIAKNDEINRQKAEIDDKNIQLEEKNASLDTLNHKLVEEMAERESIEQSSFARDRFLATMSHEMRTPMNIIIGLTHLLLEESPKPDQIEHLRTLQFSANNLVVFINDVLDFSKIEAGKLTLESRAFSLVDTFEDTKQRFHLPAKDKDVALNYNYDDKLPKKVMGDPVRLNQIMTNLVCNAVKFTERGAVNIDVKLHDLTGKDMTVVVIVEDSGIGMTPEKMNDLFLQTPVKTGDIMEGYSSSGLGLAITKRLVDLQNGKLEVQSEIGRGTTFTVYLPFKQASETDDQKVTKKTPPTFDHLENNKILLVEDNRINQLVVAKMLRKLGMEVVTADNGLEALDRFEESYFDLVLMDIQMPEMDGYRATAEIRKSTDPRKRDVPIIALTASAFLTEKEKAKLFGMNDHVGKPFGPEDLLEKISNCLKMYKTA